MRPLNVTTPLMGVSGAKGLTRDDAENFTTHGTVLVGRGIHAYETAKRWLSNHRPELSAAEYLAACRAFARMAGV